MDVDCVTCFAQFGVPFGVSAMPCLAVDTEVQVRGLCPRCKDIPVLKCCEYCTSALPFPFAFVYMINGTENILLHA